MVRRSLSLLVGLFMASGAFAGWAQPQPNPLALMRADHIMISTADYQGTVD